MRLDEWQKYIGSQFLDDEPEPVPPAAEVPMPVSVPVTNSAPPEPLPPTVFASQEPTSESSDRSLPTEQAAQVEPRVVESQVSGARPETAPNAIQNIVTMVVAPSTSEPAVPAPRPPRIELLTPLPEQTDTPARSETQPEVNNRTRRRSQTANSTPASEPVSPSSPNNAAGVAAGFAEEQNPFHPVLDLDTEIPAFNQYLPASHSLSALHPTSTLPSSSNGSTSAAPASPSTPLATSSRDEEAGPRRNPRSRARHARNVRPENVPSGLSAAELWATVPRHVQTLLSLERLEEEKEVAQSSYKRPFQEKRHELIERLLDPILSLEDTARLLNVCPTTVRRYTNKGILTYYRKEPERSKNTGEINGTSENGSEKETRQRRFRLSDILAFLETQQSALAADRRAEQRAAQPAADLFDSNGKDA